jgi:glycosyltransferase involved in cell wall biosynthesis
MLSHTPNAVGALKVSAIICTRNRSLSLSRALRSMSALELDDVAGFELFVVDNGSTDGTRRVVNDFAATAHFHVNYVFEPRTGLSFARNRGLTAATGDLIMFTDDDCLVAPGWVTTAARVFAHDLLQIVAGRVELFDETQPSLVKKTSTRRETLASPGQLFGFVHGANFAFGRCVVERIGLFDVRFGAGTRLCSAEDTEFVYRALIHGVPVTYEPTLIIHHDHGRTGEREAYRQARGYAIGMGAMLAKDLSAGRTDLIKPIYWDFCSALRGWWADWKSWRWPLAKTALVAGVVRYLLQASWKKAA